MMNPTNFKNWLLIAALALVAACTAPGPAEEGLKDAFEGKFYIGCAMNEAQIDGSDTASVGLIQKHFNSVVAENWMKSGHIQPIEGEFDFELSDKVIDFAQANDMYTVGHCLIWHSQAPRWFFVDEDGNDVSREVLIERMRTHIFTVVGRYKGKVNSWDVVNEAFEDDGSWRKTKFYQIIGEEYMELAFKFANEADPDADLLYNDYSMYHKGRREAAIELVSNLRSKGVRIDGVGMQAHFGLDSPTMEELEKSIIAYAEAGAVVHITELDVTVLPNPDPGIGAEVSASFEYKQSLNPYAEGLPDSVSVALHDQYLGFFEVFIKHSDKIKRVTTWGLTDLHSWKNDWPVRGRTNYPLLFNREYEPKPVVESIINAGKE